jgi:hypothetical protein
VRDDDPVREDAMSARLDEEKAAFQIAMAFGGALPPSAAEARERIGGVIDLLERARIHYAEPNCIHLPPEMVEGVINELSAAFADLSLEGPIS